MLHSLPVKITKREGVDRIGNEVAVSEPSTKFFSGRFTFGAVDQLGHRRRRQPQPQPKKFRVWLSGKLVTHGQSMGFEVCQRLVEPDAGVYVGAIT